MFTPIAAISWIPERASTTAEPVDALVSALLIVSAFFMVTIFGCIIVFSLRYRRGSNADRRLSHKAALSLELTWTIIPIIIGLCLFSWGAQAYVRMNRIPSDALEVYVVGKQWMWKLQHAEGPREINELHVPVGKPVKLLMTSQDVIHSFFIPAFRTKRDVLPGRFEAEWFQATKPGEFYIFCAEYCGTEHSRMRGRIIVESPEAYARWISQHADKQTVAATGEKLFQQLACNSCHEQQRSERGPALVDVYGKTVRLSNGTACDADESYLARSILNPKAEIVAGFAPTMPSYRGQVDEQQVVALIAYIKSLRTSLPDTAASNRRDPNLIVSTLGIEE